MEKINISIFLINLTMIVLTINIFWITRKYIKLRKFVIDIMQKQNCINRANLEAFNDIYKCLSCLIPDEEEENDRKD